MMLPTFEKVGASAAIPARVGVSAGERLVGAPGGGVGIGAAQATRNRTNATAEPTTMKLLTGAPPSGLQFYFETIGTVNEIGEESQLADLTAAKPALILLIYSEFV